MSKICDTLNEDEILTLLKNSKNPVKEIRVLFISLCKIRKSIENEYSMFTRIKDHIKKTLNIHQNKNVGKKEKVRALLKSFTVVLKNLNQEIKNLDNGLEIKDILIRKSNEFLGLKFEYVKKFESLGIKIEHTN